jgi:hypothetical protein
MDRIDFGIRMSLAMWGAEVNRVALWVTKIRAKSGRRSASPIQKKNAGLGTLRLFLVFSELRAGSV